MQKDQKKSVISQFQDHGKDTGSDKVQVAILTNRINLLTDHLKTHKKDKHSRRGLIGLVSRRRKILMKIRRQNPAGYKKLTKELSIRATAS